MILLPGTVGSAGYAYVFRPWLAQGSKPEGPLPFDMIVLCAAEHQPDLPGALHAPFHDREEPSDGDLRTAFAAARRVRKAVLDKKRVLVTCYLGWNRSGLVTGLALVELGDPAERAIRRIRRARGPHALGNRTFESLVRAHEQTLRVLGR